MSEVPVEVVVTDGLVEISPSLCCEIEIHWKDLRVWITWWRRSALQEPTAAVLVSQAEAIVRSLTNMAAPDSNGYLKSNYMLNINNRRTKHYTYSYIHVRTFTKTEPVSLSNPTIQPCLLVKPVDGFKGF